jgi:anti-sigma B factor antagonist
VAIFQAQILGGDGYAVVSASGELDLGTVSILRTALQNVVVPGVRLVVVDAAELNFIDSSGLGALVGAHKQLTAQGGRLVVANLPSRLYKPVHVTGLAKAIPTQVTDEPTTPWAGATTPAEILDALGFTAGVTGGHPTG